jgi:uncharacterized protein (TIGR03083 family)
VELDHLEILRRELAAFPDCLSGDLTAPVEHCGDWTVRDLAAHLGQGNLWAAVAVTERRGDYRPSAAPAGLAAWFGETARVLTSALEADPDTEAWTFAPPRTVGFWRRRRCLETVVHRWDAEHAQGGPAAVDPALCGDGIAEVFEVFVPRQIRRGRCAEPSAAVRFTATDLGTSWVLGPGDPVADLAGPARDIMLALWNREPWSRLTGDHEIARQALPGPLVP